MEKVTKEELEELKKSGTKLLVDFYADWCMPCKTLTPILEKIDGDYEDVTFVKFDIDKDKEYAMEQGVRSIPTVKMFNGEELLNTTTGSRPDSQYRTLIDDLLK